MSTLRNTDKKNAACRAMALIKHASHAAIMIMLTLMILILLIVQMDPGSMSWADSSCDTNTDESHPLECTETFTEYSSLMDIVAERDSIIIPGMRQTHVRVLQGSKLADEACKVAVPQGVTVVDDYLLLSAYCGKGKVKEKAEEHTHPSVLYVLDKSTGKYITTISLYEKGDKAVCELDGDSFAGYKASTNHVGGIAYDGSSRIYVAKSNDRNISVISKARLTAAVGKAQSQSVDGFAMSYDDEVSCNDYKASFVTWHDGKLFVGVFNTNVPNGLYGFTISGEDGSLTSTQEISYPISAGANGAVFYESNGRECLAVNSSFGRNTDSTMNLYEVSSNTSTSTRINFIDSIKLPPMAEEMTIDNGLLYTAFESASPLYSDPDYADPDKGVCNAILDRICVADAKEVFYWTKYPALSADETSLSTAGAVLDSSTISDSSENLIDQYREVTGNYVNHDSGSSLGTGFMYSDSMLMVDATKGGSDGYSDLTKIGVALAASAYQSSNVSSMLAGMGYTKINQYNYGVKSTYEDNDRVAFSVAQKVVYQGGKRTVLYVVPVRGTYDAEWYSDFHLGTSGTHEGFKLSYDQIIDVLKKDFFEFDGADSSSRKIFITGHSRGAAVGNMLAGSLTGSSYIDQSGVFAYTFACPAVSKTANISLKNIYNFNYKGDLIPTLPLEKWDYHRYGTTIEYSPDSNSSRRFAAVYGEAFAGKDDTPAAVIDAMETLVPSEADFHNDYNLLLYDTAAFVLNKGHDPDDWKKILKAHGWSALDEIVEKIVGLKTGMAWFKELKVENDAWVELNSEIPAGKNNWAEYKEKDEYGSTVEEKWSHWKTDHTELITKVEKYTTVTINEEADFDKAQQVVNERMLMYKSKPVSQITDVLVLIFTTDNEILPAITHGHTPENYVTAMNSRYFGYEGWAGSDTIAADLSDTTYGEIKGVGTNCFSGCTALKAITMPDGGIDYAGSKAFAGLNNLTIINNGDLRINYFVGSEAFNGCSGIQEVILGDKVSSIQRDTFNNCSGLKKITMPISAKYICYESSYVSQMTYGTDYYYSFNGCSNVEEITFTKGTGEAMQYSWGNKSQYNSSGYGYTDTGSYKYGLPYLSREKLTKVTVGEGITELPDDFLRGCSNVTELSLPGTLKTIGENALSGCKLSSNTVIPDSVEKIGAGAFSGCTGLTSAVVPEGVTSVPASAFSGCTNLTSITLPGYLDEIGSYAFSGSGITSITIPEGVTAIPESCFENCAGLASISLPDTLTSIQGNAFKSAGLTSVVIPDKVESIATDGFKDCGSLRKVTMPISVKYSCLEDRYVSQMTYGSNYYYSFSGCTNVEELHFTKGSGVTTQYSWNNYSNYNSSGYGSTGTGSYQYALPYIAREHLTTVTVDDGINELPQDFLRGCSNVVNVKLPGSLRIIGEAAFMGCKLSSDTVIPAGVESVGASAFSGCTGLASVSIAGVSKVPAGIFSGCTSLTSVTMPKTATEVGSAAFTGTAVEEIAIPDGVTTLPESCFKDCTKLVTVTLPETLTSIEGNAFAGSGLQEIVIPDNVGRIATDAFNNCSGLKKISLPLSAKYSCYQGTSYGTMYTDRYDYYSFRGCNNVEEIHFTKGSGEVMQYSWADESSSGYTCRGSYTYGLPYLSSGKLTTVIIEDGVTEIPVNLVAGCGNIETLILPDTLKIIGSGAFSSCSKVPAVMLSGSIETIGSGAFPKSVDIYTARDSAADTFAQSNGNNVYYINDPQITADSYTMAPEDSQQLSFTFVSGIGSIETLKAGEWKITSAASGNTTITDGGLLTIASDETGPVTVEVTYKGHTSSHPAEFKIERDTRKEALKALTALIAECDKIVSEPAAYTDDSFVLFSEALTNAKAVAANESATEAEFVAAREALEAAKDGLVISCEHVWDEGKVTTEPSCTEQGVMTYTCTKCGKTREEPIASLGHEPAEAVQENVTEATCEEAGSYDEVVYCARCHEELTRETRTTEALEHDWGEWVPDETAPDEYEIRTCRRCGETERLSILEGEADRLLAEAEAAAEEAAVKAEEAREQADMASAEAEKDDPSDDVISKADKAADDSVQAANAALEAAEKAIEAANKAYGDGSAEVQSAETLAAEARSRAADAATSKASTAKSAATTAGKKAEAAARKAQIAAEAAAQAGDTPGQAALDAAKAAKEAADEAADKAKAAKEAADAAVRAAETAAQAVAADPEASQDEIDAAQQAVSDAEAASAEAETALSNATNAAADADTVYRDAEAKKAQADEEARRAAEAAAAAKRAEEAKAAAARETARQGVLDTSMPKISISKPKAAKKSFTAKWKKVNKKKLKKVQKIEVWVCMNKSFGPNDTIMKVTGKKKSSLKIKGLQAKKKYFVKVRTIRYANGVKYVSKWSKVKSIKVK